MFDIGFSEMIVVAVIALIVLGPEKLPRVARMAGHLLGRMQRYVNDVKADINREIELDELRKLQKEMQNTASSIEQTVKSELNSVESSLKQIGDSTQQALSAPGSGSAVSDPPYIDPIADAFADPPPVQPATTPSAIAQLEPLREPPLDPASAAVSQSSPQLELGLEAAPLANAPPPGVTAVTPSTAKA